MRMIVSLSMMPALRAMLQTFSPIMFALAADRRALIISSSVAVSVP